MGNLSKTFRYENELGQNIIFDYPFGYIINKPVGIDTLNVSLTKAGGFDQIGDIVQNAKIQSRPLQISGIITNNANVMESKERLLSVIRPDLKGRLYADDFYLEVVPTTTPSIEPKPQFARFSFNLLAAYPYWVLNETESVNTAGENTLEINNGGQVPVPFTVDFEATGAVNQPAITDAVTGEFLKINKSMSAGETVKIQISHTKVDVISSVSGDIRGMLTLDSNMFRLPIGDNILNVSATSGVENLKTTVSYSLEKAGIVL